MKSIGEWLDVIPKDTFATNGFVEFELYRFDDGWSWNEMESKRAKEHGSGCQLSSHVYGQKVPAGINLWIANASGRYSHNIERARTDYSDWQCQIVDESYRCRYQNRSRPTGIRTGIDRGEILESLGEDPEK